MFFLMEMSTTHGGGGSWGRKCQLIMYASYDSPEESRESKKKVPSYRNIFRPFFSIEVIPV